MSPVSTNRSPSSPAAAAPTELLPLDAGPSRATVMRDMGGAGWAGIDAEDSPGRSDPDYRRRRLPAASAIEPARRSTSPEPMPTHDPGPGIGPYGAPKLSVNMLLSAYAEKASSVVSPN